MCRSKLFISTTVRARAAHYRIHRPTMRECMRVRVRIVLCLLLVLFLLSLDSNQIRGIVRTYFLFKQQFRAPETVQEMNGSRPAGNSSTEPVDLLVEMLEKQSIINDLFWKWSYNDIREALRHNLTSARYLVNIGEIAPKQDDISSWTKFMHNINDHYLYDWNDDSVDALLMDLAKLPIENVEQQTQGIDLPFNLTLTDALGAIATPMRFPRERESNPDHFPMDELENHVAEIASFHLDKVLGFCRVPPTVGRRVNLTAFREITKGKVGLIFYNSPADNTCFYGTCGEKCSVRYAYCGQGETMEFSMMLHVGNTLHENQLTRRYVNPYKHASSRKLKAKWEIRADYCDIVKRVSPYRQPKVLLNIIDTHIFDFLTGNRDRKTITYFTKFGSTSNPFLYNNGKGFGTSERDYVALLTPLRQCCKIKRSTFLKLVKLYRGPERLSSLMNDSLKSDPVNPVLLPAHLQALDRRVGKVLSAVAECIFVRGWSLERVVIDDF